VSIHCLSAVLSNKFQDHQAISDSVPRCQSAPIPQLQKISFFILKRRWSFNNQFNPRNKTNLSYSKPHKSKLIPTPTLLKRSWVLALRLINYFCVSCPLHVVRVNWCTNWVWNFFSLPEIRLQHFSSLISTRTLYTFCGCENLTGDKTRAFEAWLKKTKQIISSWILLI